jgi:hypothetical protein
VFSRDLHLCTGPVMRGSFACATPVFECARSSIPLLFLYGGDSSHEPANATSLLYVQPAAPILNFTTATATRPIRFGDSVTFVVRISYAQANGTVVVAVGAVRLCVMTISAGYGSCTSRQVPASWNNQQQHLSLPPTVAMTAFYRFQRPLASLLSEHRAPSQHSVVRHQPATAAQ